MTGNERRGHGRGPAGDGREVPQGPPWSFDDLADLHAGLLTADASAELRARISTDAEAQSMLAALDAIQADLHDLPPIAMPDDVAARLDAALAEESRKRASPATTTPAASPTTDVPPAPPPLGTPHPGTAPPSDGARVLSLDAARRRRRQRLGWGAGVLTAAAAAVAVVVALPGQHTESGTPQAIPTDTVSHQPGSVGNLPPLDVTPGTIGSAFAQATNVTDYGPLQSPDRMFACLSAVGIPDPGKPLGVRQVTLRQSATDPGKAGVLVVLPGGKAGTFRLVVVGANCSAASPEKLADTRIPNG